MPSFEWKGRGRSGQDQTGVLTADNKDAAISILRRQQIVVTAVKERGKEIAVPLSTPPEIGFRIGRGAGGGSSRLTFTS